ncbi:MAG: AsnC family protein, partial [Bacteroidota bacterium]
QHGNIVEFYIDVLREAIKGEFELALLQNQKANEAAQSQLIQKQQKEKYTLIVIALVLIALVLLYARTRNLAHRKEQAGLLDEIERLKNLGKSSALMQSKGFQLDRGKVESAIDRPLNETDWKVLNLLLDDPVISNKEIAQQAFMSVDGIGSSLRRMYSAFEIKESRYKKISLLIEAIKISNS